jgi:hypothetical protein
VHDDRTGEGDLGRGAVGGDLGDVGEETAAGLDGQPGGDPLPSGEDGMTTAAGDFSCTSCASTSAFGATR